MNKGDTFTLHLDGDVLTVCVVGFYSEEYSGEEMVILALVSPDNLVHVPMDDLEALFPKPRYIN